MLTAVNDVTASIFNREYVNLSFRIYRKVLTPRNWMHSPQVLGSPWVWPHWLMKLALTLQPMWQRTLGKLLAPALVVEMWKF